MLSVNIREINNKKINIQRYLEYLRGNILSCSLLGLLNYFDKIKIINY